MTDKAHTVASVEQTLRMAAGELFRISETPEGQELIDVGDLSAVQLALALVASRVKGQMKPVEYDRAS